jgi:hypothetical protein
MTIDATLPEDSSYVSTWPAYIREARTLANTNESAIAGEYAMDVEAQNSTATVTFKSKVVTVNSAAAVTLTLTELTALNIGQLLEIHKMGIGNLTITMGGSDTLADGAAGTTVVNSTAGEAKAANMIIRCVAAGQAVIHSMLGTWV